MGLLGGLMTGASCNEIACQDEAEECADDCGEGGEELGDDAAAGEIGQVDLSEVRVGGDALVDS